VTAPALTETKARYKLKGEIKILQLEYINVKSQELGSETIALKPFHPFIPP
jgi:hypothetical protein